MHNGCNRRGFCHKQRSEKMRQLVKDVMLGGFIAALVALTVYEVMTLPAKADEPAGPPPPGSYVTIRQPMVNCDSLDQIKQIAAAMLVSDKAAADKIDELHAITNTNKEGEPACMFGPLLAAVAVGESVALPDIKLKDIEVKAYAIHVGTARGDWYSLYLIPRNS